MKLNRKKIIILGCIIIFSIFILFSIINLKKIVESRTEEIVSNALEEAEPDTVNINVPEELGIGDKSTFHAPESIYFDEYKLEFLGTYSMNIVYDKYLYLKVPVEITNTSSQPSTTPPYYSIKAYNPTGQEVSINYNANDSISSIDGMLAGTTLNTNIYIPYRDFGNYVLIIN